MTDIIDKIKALILKAGDWLFEVKPVSIKISPPKKIAVVACKSKNKRPKKK